jgi:hypothetical protein
MNPFSTLSEQPYPVPPEAVPPTPRRVVMTRWSRWLRYLLVSSLLIGHNLILVFGYFAGSNLRALDDTGVQITGKVEYRWQTSSRNGSVNHISYVIYVDGKRRIKETTVSWDIYYNLKEGGPCAVTYLPADPDINCLGAPSPQLVSLNKTFLTIAGIIGLAVGVMVACFEVSLRREIRLATHGLATVGLIIDNGSQRTKNGTVYWSRYEFSSPTNEHARGCHYIPYNIWGLIPRGTPVTILYDPECPSRHMPLYAFKRVRVLHEDVAALPEALPVRSVSQSSQAITDLPHTRAFQS